MPLLSPLSAQKPPSQLSRAAARRFWGAAVAIAVLMLIPALALHTSWSAAEAGAKTLGRGVFELVDSTSRSGVFFLALGTGLLCFYRSLLVEVLALASLASGDKTESSFDRGFQLYRNGSRLRNTAAFWALVVTMLLCVIALVAAPAKVDLLAPGVALGTCLLAALLIISPLMNFLIPPELRNLFSQAEKQAWLDKVFATFKETPWGSPRLNGSRFVLSTYQFPLPFLYALAENANQMPELAREAEYL